MPACGTSSVHTQSPMYHCVRLEHAPIDPAVDAHNKQDAMAAAHEKEAEAAAFALKAKGELEQAKRDAAKAKFLEKQAEAKVKTAKEKEKEVRAFFLVSENDAKSLRAHMQ